MATHFAYNALPNRAGMRIILILSIKHLHIFSSNYQASIDCPTCQSKTQFPFGMVSKLPKNIVLLDLMEAVGITDRSLDQKQILDILTEVS